MNFFTMAGTGTTVELIGPRPSKIVETYDTTFPPIPPPGGGGVSGGNDGLGIFLTV